jgi:hypothetical protein
VLTTSIVTHRPDDGIRLIKSTGCLSVCVSPTNTTYVGKVGKLVLPRTSCSSVQLLLLLDAKLNDAVNTLKRTVSKVLNAIDRKMYIQFGNILIAHSIRIGSLYDGYYVLWKWCVLQLVEHSIVLLSFIVVITL